MNKQETINALRLLIAATDNGDERLQILNSILLLADDLPVNLTHDLQQLTALVEKYHGRIDLLQFVIEHGEQP